MPNIVIAEPASNAKPAERMAPIRIFARHGLAARAGAALLLVNVRYWTTVAPLVRAQLLRWEQRARAIPDRELQSLALRQLGTERFHSEAAATLATLAASEHRPRVVEAIVATTVMAEYLNAVSEQPAPDPLVVGHRLYTAFRQAVAPEVELTGDYYSDQRDDGGYLRELARTVRSSLKSLPAAAAVADPMQRSAAHYCEIEVRAHAVGRVDVEPLESWARREATAADLHWRELVAGGAAAVLSVDALIVAAADERTTAEQAAAIDRTYLFISALTTMLDSLVDRASDIRIGKSSISYLQYYESSASLREELLETIGKAVANALTAPNCAHHIMIAVSAVAYYTSEPQARSEPIRSVVAPLHQLLRPLIWPTLAVMYAWRAAKRLRERLRGEVVSTKPLDGHDRLTLLAPSVHHKGRPQSEAQR